MTLAVIDTNVLVSALRSPGGNEAAVIAAVRDRGITPCTSDAIRGEYGRVLGRPRLGFTAVEIRLALAAFDSYERSFSPGGSALVSPDPGDTKFIACAVAARARFLVTGDRRHFPEPFYGTAEVVNVRQLLDRLAARA